ncbi:MAG TPA: SRPBCC family protein, partial [Chitinophagales bacterium]|nr:SRPBCC family protein [Chitinophagales bacterium]
MINLLYLLGGFISGVLLLAFFVKKNYTIARSIIIRQPKSLVFDYIKLLKNQDNYSKWATMDPNMNKTYRGTDGTVGFVSAWESPNRNVGKGEQELTNVIQGERIESELRFFRPFTS